jgi:hypothetical protein
VEVGKKEINKDRKRKRQKEINREERKQTGIGRGREGRAEIVCDKCMTKKSEN